MTVAGLYDTVAEPVIRLTFAPLTPGVRSSVRCTRALHAAQVMPCTGIVSSLVCGVRVAVMLSLGSQSWTVAR